MTEKSVDSLAPITDPMGRVLWDAIMMMAILLTAITIPYEMVFGFYRFEPIYWVTTFLFTADILVHFRSSVQRGHIVITDEREILKHYLRTWFCIDIISALPLLPLAVGMGMTSTSFLTFVHSLRLIRVFRLAKANATIKNLALHINPSLIRLFQFFIWFVILVHMLSLGWVYVTGTPIGMEDVRRYLLALYWTITTIGGVGYGDIVPDKTSYIEISYTIGVELVGVVVFGYIIGNITSLVTNLDLARANFRKKLEDVDNFFRLRKVPRHLHEKVRNYYAYLWDTRRNADAAEILQDLPHTLQIEISLFLNQDVLRKVSLFEELSKEFIHELVLMLEPAVFLPGDYIIREGEFADCMYFIASGDVEIIINNKSVAILSAGSPFGEGALVNDKKRNASARAVGYCDVYKLSKRNFEKLRERYPEFDRHVREIVVKREKDTAAKMKND